ncbi:MAG: hypothetical protein JRF36_07455 [Deltaproteobacteria bacterium]|jgi:hypothetical protein|nr:hypothetical protein [Deltaproteobacteria bacterium]
MLDTIIPKLRLQVAKAHKILPQDIAASVEKVYNDILLMRDFTLNEFQRIQDDANLNENDRNIARRQVLEKAITKLEMLKSRRSAADLIERLEAKLSQDPEANGDHLLKFLKEREVRDRLAGMTEAQILSHFKKSLLEGSNQLLLDAILNAPPGFEMLSPKLLKKLKRVRGKHYYPEVVAQLQAMQEMNAIIIKIFTLVRAELDKLRKKYLPIYIVEKSA